MIETKHGQVEDQHKHDDRSAAEDNGGINLAQER